MIDEGAGFGGQQFLAGEVEGYGAKVSVLIRQQALERAAFQMPFHIGYGDHCHSQSQQGRPAYRLGIVGHHAGFVYQCSFDAFAVAHPPDA